MRRVVLAATLCVAGVGGALAGSATWTWPVARTDGSALPLSAIGSFTVYDTSLPIPGQPGTVVVGCTAAAIAAPTTPTGSCPSAAFPIGHTFVIVVGDTNIPPVLSAPSNVASAAPPAAPPRAVTDFKVTGP